MVGVSHPHVRAIPGDPDRHKEKEVLDAEVQFVDLLRGIGFDGVVV